jgi:hypothetical protein
MGGGRVRAGLKSAGSGQALHCGLGLLQACPAGLAQKPGPRGLGPGPAPALGGGVDDKAIYNYTCTQKG